MRKNKVTLLIPTMNEIAGLKSIMPRIRPGWYDQLIILDGGSTDGTIEYARQRGYEIHVQKRKGLRMAYIENHPNVRGDVVVTFSPDGNSVPERIPDLVAKMEEGFDMVIVSRYIGGARSFDDTPLTRLGNLFFTTLINSLFHHRYTDSLVIYRAYRKDVIDRLGILTERSEWYEDFIGRFVSWEPQLSVRCAKERLKTAEIPGDEPKRVSDEASAQVFLPSSRIRHFRVGFACLLMILDEALRP